MRNFTGYNRPGGIDATLCRPVNVDSYAPAFFLPLNQTLPERGRYGFASDDQIRQIGSESAEIRFNPDFDDARRAVDDIDWILIQCPFQLLDIELMDVIQN